MSRPKPTRKAARRGSPRIAKEQRRRPAWLASPALLLGIILASLLLAAFGVVQLRGNSLLSGTIAIIVALTLFVAASGRLSTISLSRRQLLEGVRSWIPGALVLVAGFASILASYQVTLPRSAQTSRNALILWIASLVLLITGTLWIERWHPTLVSARQWAGKHGREILLVLVILVLALGVRLYQLDQHPYPWSGDEASIGIEGRRILTGENNDFFNTGWSGQPNLSFISATAALALFGNSILALRLVSALVGALTVLTLFLLCRESFGSTVALIASAFLVAFPLHLQFSRIAVHNIFDGLTVTLALWLVFRAVRSGKYSDYVWAGLATGSTLYTYVGSRLVIALAFAALACVAILQRGYLRSHIRQLLAYVGSVFIMVAPMAVFFARHPDIFMTRLGQAGILWNGWLGREAASSGRTAAAVLLDQFGRSTLVYIANGAQGNFFNSPQPYLTILGSLFFLVGMVYAFQRIRKPQYAALLIWFWSVVFFGGVLTVDPPASMRLVMSAPAVAIFVGLGIMRLLEVLKVLGVGQNWRLALGAAVIVLLAVQDAAFYFGTYRSGAYFQDLNAELAMKAGGELRRLGPEYTLYFIGQPRMFSGFPTIPFLAPDNPRIDVDPKGGVPTDLGSHLPALILATPDNLPLLQEFGADHPGGAWQQVQSESRPETLYYAYTIEK